MTNSSFNSSPERVAKRYSNLKDSSPRKYAEVVEAFRDMAHGGKGGSVYLNYIGTVSVRKYYFRGWSDADFERLLGLLGESL